MEKVSESKTERASRLLRNFNIIGAVAMGGAAVIFPEFAVPLFALAAVNVAQAGAFELAGQYAKRRRTSRLATA